MYCQAPGVVMVAFKTFHPEPSKASSVDLPMCAKCARREIQDSVDAYWQVSDEINALAEKHYVLQDECEDHRAKVQDFKMQWRN